MILLLVLSSLFSCIFSVLPTRDARLANPFFPFAFYRSPFPALVFIASVSTNPPAFWRKRSQPTQARPSAWHGTWMVLPCAPPVRTVA